MMPVPSLELEIENPPCKEVKQFDYMDVVEPTHHEDMTEEQKEKALRYLMFLKEKLFSQGI